jgi:hypothetical protein
MHKRIAHLSRWGDSAGDGGPRAMPSPLMVQSRKTLMAAAVAWATGLVAMTVIVPPTTGAYARPLPSAVDPSPWSASLAGRPIAQIPLTPPNGGASPLGIAEVLRYRHSYSVRVVAEGVKRVGRVAVYAVWLWRSRTSAKLITLVSPEAGAPHRLRADAALPRHLKRYRKLLITLQHRPHLRRPGRIILRGVWPFR